MSALGTVTISSPAKLTLMLLIRMDLISVLSRPSAFISIPFGPEGRNDLTISLILLIPNVDTLRKMTVSKTASTRNTETSTDEAVLRNFIRKDYNNAGTLK